MFGEVASKQNRQLKDAEVWTCTLPGLGGSLRVPHLSPWLPPQSDNPESPICVLKWPLDGLRSFQCEFSGGRAWSETLQWIGLFVNSNRQLWRAIKNSNYVNRPEKNDCLQKSVAITRHNGSQLGWRGFSVIHNSLS